MGHRYLLGLEGKLVFAATHLETVWLLIWLMLQPVVQNNNWNKSVACVWGKFLDRRKHKSDCCTLMMEQLRSFETPVITYPSTLRNVSEDLNLREDRRENPVPSTCTVLGACPSD